ncbi:hypothetical protein [Nitrospira sp. Nam74]
MARFLTALYPDLQGQWCLFWQLPSKRSSWVNAIDAALIDQLLEWAKSGSIYVGCGLSPRNFGPTMRCPADQISAIPGLWMDVDVRGSGHKKQNLPPTLADAHALIREMGPEPTIIVNSGHGLQVWWLFKELWVLESDEERKAAAKLVRDWTATLRARAKAHGWDIDATFDLARVLRPPGSLNHKGAPILPVTTDTFADEKRLEPSAFEQWVLVEAAEADTLPDLEWTFKVRADANPPPQKFFLLGNMDPQFYLSWEYKRTEWQDQSPSSYDMALATRAMMAGWTAQEIVDLLIACRRYHGQELKLRPDYFRVTLNKAAKGKGMEERQKWIDELKAGNDLPPEIVSDSAETLAIISGALGVQVTKVMAISGDPITYEMVIHNRTIKIGLIENLLSFAKFRATFANATRKVLDKQKSKAWDKIVQYFLDVAEDVECGPEATEEGMFESWLRAYLNYRVLDADNQAEALQTHTPFQKNGHVYVTTEGLGRYIAGYFREKVDPRQLAKRLTKAGGHGERLHFKTKGGAESTIYTYRLNSSLYIGEKK